MKYISQSLKFITIVLIVFYGLCFSSSNAATSIKNTHATASLFSEVTATEPGKTIWLVLSLKMQPGWHSYWKNPGDTGLPPKIKWQVPNGVKIDNMQFLTPTRFDTNGIVSYGYAKQAYYLIPITFAKTINLHNVLIKADVDYLVCEQECIPEFASLTLPLRIANKTILSQQAEKVRALLQQLPKAYPANVSFSVNQKNITLNIPIDQLQQQIKTAYFFSEQPSVVDINRAQTFQVNAQQLLLTLPRDYLPPNDILPGILKLGTSKGQQSFHISAHNTVAISSVNWQFWRAILFALLGGIILNAMPCVFPILSLKALSLVKQASAEPRVVRLNGLSYTAGVVLSFVLLGGLLIILKLGGTQLGWGFQMQSPLFVAIMFLLLFIIALNLLGVFEFTSRLSNIGQNLVTGKQQYWSSFFTGVLATIVATPCTAPFMGVAMGYAFTQPVAVILLFFVMLGFGLALPFLLLSFSPSLTRFLPKPGNWMVTFKELMAFPILLTCIWLLWVLTQQIGGQGLVMALLAAFIIGFGLWLWRKQKMPWLKRITVLLLSVLLIVFLFHLHNLQTVKSPQSDSTVQPLKQVFSMQRLQQLRKQGKPVFVNVTADWCITCKVNERGALANAEVLQTLKQRKIHYLVADWTNTNAKITEYLASFNRQGVPLYVFYPVDKPPVVLPQLLTKQQLLTTFQ